MTSITSPRLAPKPAREPNRRPPLWLLASEPLRAAVEALQAVGQALLPAEPLGEGHTVVLFPGLGTDGALLWPLRRHLERAGFRVLDWGQGVNTGPSGDPDAWLDDLATALDARIGPVPELSLVGWSLGGLYARELAKRWPARVRHVVTIGTPFNGSADDTHVGWVYRLLNGQPAPGEAALLERLAEPPPVPTTSLYSRRDGLVSWEACTHARRWPQARDIEVEASHLGMGCAPQVLAQVTRLLAPQAAGARA